MPIQAENTECAQPESICFPLSSCFARQKKKIHILEQFEIPRRCGHFVFWKLLARSVLGYCLKSNGRHKSYLNMGSLKGRTPVGKIASFFARSESCRWRWRNVCGHLHLLNLAPALRLHKQQESFLVPGRKVLSSAEGIKLSWRGHWKQQGLASSPRSLKEKAMHQAGHQRYCPS